MPASDISSAWLASTYELDTGSTIGATSSSGTMGGSCSAGAVAGLETATGVGFAAIVLTS